MKKVFTAVVVLLLILSGCGINDTPVEETVLPVVEQSLYLKGDLDKWVTLDEVWPELSTTMIGSKDGVEETVPAIPLNDFLDSAGKLFDQNHLYLIADDGFMVKLDDQTTDDTYLIHENSLGWCYISDKHPVNAGIKGIREIIVVGRDVDAYDYEDRGLGFNVIEGDNNRWFTRGQLLMEKDTVLNLFDGESTYQGIAIDVMKQHHVISLASLIEGGEQRLLLMTADGDQNYLTEPSGHIEVSESFITYFDDEDYKKTHKVLGLVIDPPAVSLMDNYYDVEYYLNTGIPVMTLFLDGFSYEQLNKFVRVNTGSYLAGLPDISKALGVYKPVTNAGFAAMVTGQLPKINGIYDRNNREPVVTTVFDMAQSLGMSHLLVEGDVNILKLATDTIINIDSNGDGMTDDEIHQSAMEALNRDLDYLMVHYHSIDEMGHEYGPYSKETMNQIKVIDSYVDEIISQWQGTVIITADHGMHETAEGGDHGMLVSEDMFVPYILVNNR